MSRFQDQVAVITGASDGIGRATALTMAREGASVVLVARRQDKLQAVADEITAAGGQAIVIAGDATQAGLAETAVTSAERAWGRIDILVNNVGGATVIEKPASTIDELSHADWQKLISFNLDATFHFCHAVIPVMKRRRFGKIVNVSSVAGRGLGVVSGCAYVAAKAGIIGLTKKLATEVGPWNINVNATAPSLTVTDRLQAYWQGMDEAAQQAYLEKIPLRRVGTAQDQANVICFLSSAQSSFLTGLTIDVTGGQF